MTNVRKETVEAAVNRIAKGEPRFRDEPQAYKRACIRMGYEAGAHDGIDEIVRLRAHVAQMANCLRDVCDHIEPHNDTLDECYAHIPAEVMSCIIALMSKRKPSA